MAPRDVVGAPAGAALTDGRAIRCHQTGARREEVRDNRPRALLERFLEVS